MRALGALLRERRVLAGLSRSSLAGLAGLSEATIKFIEFGKHRPRKKTLLKLYAVSYLSLSADDLGLNPEALPPPRRGSSGADPFVAALLFHRIRRRIARVKRRAQRDATPESS